MLTFWRNLSVAKKLYTVVGVMAFLVALELLTLLFAMSTLSTLRAFASGESTWSKAQKSSIHSLHLYILTQDEKYYQAFKSYLIPVMGDRRSRQELMKPNFNRDVVVQGFREGGVAETDIPRVITLITRFHNAPYLRDAIQYWNESDAKIDTLIASAEKVREKVNSGGISRQEADRFLAETSEINNQATVLAEAFSRVLGEGSRWLENMLMMGLFFAVLTVESTGLILTIAFNRNLSRSLGEINQAAKNLGEGNLSTSPLIPVRSNDELGQLAMTLNKMSMDLEKNIGQRVRAENASQVKTLFLANMSHEIRTPLGVIIGMTEIIKDPNLPESERMKYIKIIESTGKNLTGIINDILDITKVESGHLQIQRSNFDLDELLTEVADMMKMKADEQRNRFEVIKDSNLSAEVFTDRNRLQQILINLVNNAIKFTQDGVVQVRYGKQNNSIYFDVIDSGIGIPEESKKDLFQAFAQIDSSTTRKYEGTGLGLVLSKKIAQAMNGDVILLSSTLGKGSTFRVVLSAASNGTIESTSMASKSAAGLPSGFAGASTPSNSADQKQIEGKRILIVDDSSDNRLLIELYLKKKGVISDFADNGAVAVEKALANSYDIILMDMQMPVMDGYTATKTLREKGFTKPIIALTAHAMAEDRNRCLEAGCNDYLTKPVDSLKLYSTVHSYVVS
ncbi:response regulator [Bdellovibrio svalbardensis]|uniref:histidine kinase n=1 Tax=Bdellovibrio svalbardensis TaxID=2972972 RepID=A0ABT6DKC2_9BACT|nr:response regulator [Bdellovibrio svalbardensis]MDG0816962.1 response regulator [Bdellovibrio svalbardensis]